MGNSAADTTGTIQTSLTIESIEESTEESIQGVVAESLRPNLDGMSLAVSPSQWTEAIHGCSMRPIYLDYNSSTPIAGSVREAMLPFLGEFFADPASSHWMGRAAQESIEDSRSAIATLLGCHPTEIYFTSGGTESINLALLGAARRIDHSTPESSPKHLLISAIEHPVVLSCANHLAAQGWQISEVPCNSEGVITAKAVDSAIRPNTRIVSVMHANQDIGTIQPLAEIGEQCAARGILFHTDASQTVGRIRTIVDELHVDMLSFSGHKMYGPKGIGGLYVRAGVKIDPIMFGEGQEAGLRPGTESVASIAGLGQAAKLMHAAIDDAADRMAELRDRFLARLEFNLAKTLVVHGSRASRLPNTLSFELPCGSSENLLRSASELCLGPLAIRDSNGGQQILSRALKQLGLSTDQARRTIRMSLGWTTTEDDIDRAVDIIVTASQWPTQSL